MTPLPPYMVQLCQRVFNIGYKDGSEHFPAGVCTNWFYQALDHCTEVLTTKPGCQKLWKRLLNLKQLIFPEHETSLSSNKIPISVHPDLLGPTECQDLANKIIKDYIHYIPRYLSLVHENQSLWLILRGLFGVLVIGACVVLAARHYHANRAPVKKGRGNRVSIRERLLERDMQTVLYETKYLSVVPMVDPSLLRCGCLALGLKIDARKLCNIKAVLVNSIFKENAADAQSIMKLEKFFRNPGKYRIVISLDLTTDDDGDAGGCPPLSGATKNSAIPIQKSLKRVGIRRRL